MKVTGLFFIGVFAALGLTNPTQAQQDTALTAIDILLNPGETMLKHAKEANTRLLENYPEGFALDATHHPHISVLQRYVRTKDLDKVYTAVQQVTAAENPMGMELKATGYYFLPWKGLGLAGIVIKPTADLIRFQKKTDRRRRAIHRPGRDRRGLRPPGGRRRNQRGDGR